MARALCASRRASSMSKCSAITPPRSSAPPARSLAGAVRVAVEEAAQCRHQGIVSRRGGLRLDPLQLPNEPIRDFPLLVHLVEQLATPIFGLRSPLKQVTVEGLALASVPSSIQLATPLFALYHSGLDNPMHPK